MSRRTVVAAPCLFVWGLASPSAAFGPCNDHWPSDSGALNPAEVASLTGADSCRTVLNEAGRTFMSCHWSFPYRDAVAQETAGRLINSLEQCLGVEAQLEPGDVNHPDSFDQWWIDDGTQRFSVSIKDKAALQQSLVFVSFEAS